MARGGALTAPSRLGELSVTSPFSAGGEGAITLMPTPSWEKHVVPGL